MATSASRTSVPAPSVAAKVAFLGHPGAYPEGTRAVATVETHWSYVFLTDRHAYKLKKPVRSRYFDFTTEAARRRNCEEEVRLNRRLAADVYLQVVPLGQDGERLALGHGADTVDWLVKMRRLPAERTLERLMAAGRVGDGDTRQLAHTLARFHAAAGRVPLSPTGYLDTFASGVTEHLEVLAAGRYALAGKGLAEARAAIGQLFSRCRGALGERAAGGRIVEAHGDMRPEHIYLLEDGPRIVDCLEFALALRTLDPLDELSFLALECERLGSAAVGEAVLQRYLEITAESPPQELIAFYRAYRALVRARLAIEHLDAEGIVPVEKWRGRAITYLRCVHRIA